MSLNFLEELMIKYLILEDDNHWDLTLANAALTSTSNNIRQTFAIILLTSTNQINAKSKIAYHRCLRK
ncbi:unnamed protein product, partial [Ceratitis capitata]